MNTVLLSALLAATSSPATTAGGLSSGEAAVNAVQDGNDPTETTTTAARQEIGQCEPPGLPHAYVAPEQRTETLRPERAQQLADAFSERKKG